MRNARLLLVALLLFSIPVVCQNTPDTVPKDVQSLPDGFYYKNQQIWNKLQPISMAGGGLKHAGKMFVPGLTRKWCGHTVVRKHRFKYPNEGRPFL
jgi:hypothetical protein